MLFSYWKWINYCLNLEVIKLGMPLTRHWNHLLTVQPATTNNQSSHHQKDLQLSAWKTILDIWQTLEYGLLHMHQDQEETLVSCKNFMGSTKKCGIYHPEKHSVFSGNSSSLHSLLQDFSNTISCWRLTMILTNACTETHQPICEDFKQTIIKATFTSVPVIIENLKTFYLNSFNFKKSHSN